MKKKTKVSVRIISLKTQKEMGSTAYVWPYG